MQISNKVFYNLIVSRWDCVARHAQSTQNNKFAISLQYLKKNVKDQVDFFPAYKQQRFPQIDTIILCVCVPVSMWSGMPKLSKVTSLLSDEVDFLCADKHQSLPKIMMGKKF